LRIVNDDGTRWSITHTIFKADVMRGRYRGRTGLSRPRPPQAHHPPADKSEAFRNFTRLRGPGTLQPGRRLLSS
jgi:hypothetical protein